MDQDVIATHLENLDRRLANVEQILPTLATKDELNTLATKAELAAAIAPLATKAEMREEGETSRRHMTMLIEKHDHKLELLAEHVLSLMAKSPKP
jgi:hypothetical protein